MRKLGGSKDARLITLIRTGLLPLADLALTRFPLDQANEAVAHTAKTGGPFSYTVI